MDRTAQPALRFRYRRGDRNVAAGGFALSATDRRKLLAWALLCLAFGLGFHALLRLGGNAALVWALAAALLAAGALVLASRASTRAAVREQVRARADQASLESLGAAALAGSFRTPLGPLPPLSTWTITLDLAHYLLALLRTRQPRRVLEVGAGLSTLLVGKHLEEQGEGRLVSLEHDRGFFDRTREVLRAHALEDRVALLHAPLGDVAVGSGRQPWYSGFDLGDERFDLLLVDGPPGSVCARARWPALPLLHERLAPEALVVVDDVNRAGEREMVEQWRASFPAVRELEILPMGRRSVALLHWREG